MVCSSVFIALENGFQIEAPDDWLKDGNPFEMKRPEYAVEVRFGGYVTVRKDEKTGRDRFVQENYQSVMAVPYDLPVVGYGNHIVNTLRIWDAEAIDTFNLDSFDKGDYQKAVEQQNLARTICEVLYPNDNHMAGKELRLKQQYFFVSASVQRAIMKYMENHNDIHGLPEKVCFQLNDTHPTVTVPELMRILLDEYGLEWDDAWDITTRTCAYTNHTIMAEALEKWPLELFSRLLPRIYQITEEINRRFQNEIQAKYPDNQDKVKSMAIIYDGQVKMAHLAIAAGFSVNGVARLHTEILKHQELKDFYEMMPEKFNNKTNGITQIFDVQVKRLHEYKRQLLNILHVMHLYNQLKKNPGMDMYPRTFIFGAKASAGYRRAKAIIKLINSVADVVNNDASIEGKIKVVFIENYRVSNAEIIFAAADVSEQISTASKEASGTGNMKFMLNGAPTLGTMDGANVEIVEEVGEENAFIFGLSSQEVIDFEHNNQYDPKEIYNMDSDIRAVLTQLIDGTYSPENLDLFREIYNSLLETNGYERADQYFILKDFRSYEAAQKKVEEAYRDEERWAKMAMLQTAKCGKFSSDRTIEEYAKEIWHLEKVTL